MPPKSCYICTFRPAYGRNSKNRKTCSAVRPNQLIDRPALGGNGPHDMKDHLHTTDAYRFESKPYVRFGAVLVA